MLGPPVSAGVRGQSVRPYFSLIFSLCLAAQARAATLDEIFAGIRTCSFDKFYYAPWDPKPPHQYFVGREPIADSKSDQYRFKVADTLFGLPVVEIRVPGTWAFYSVTFDAPLTTARKVLRTKFGTHFPRSKKSLMGEAPALEALAGNPKQSVLYCIEPQGGE